MPASMHAARQHLQNSGFEILLIQGRYLFTEVAVLGITMLIC